MVVCLFVCLFVRFALRFSLQRAPLLFESLWWGKANEAVVSGDLSAFLACANTVEGGVVHSLVSLLQVTVSNLPPAACSSNAAIVSDVLGRG